MTEIWKEIDDRYSVSSLGRVKSNYANKERILKPFTNDFGYLIVDLRHGKDRKSVAVHRLVAFAFIDNPNPDKYKEVNHKDENKANNCADNLEWCDTRYNCNYGTRNLRKGLNCRKPICSVDINGVITRYNSRIEAERATGIDGASISKALSDRFKHNKTAGGMLWFYATDSIEQTIQEKRIQSELVTKKIYSVDKDGNKEFYQSISEAHKKTGVSNICRALKNGLTAGGRHWFYDI